MENKVKVWLARNKNGYIFVHFERPYKNTEEGLGEWISYAPNVYDKEFPLIKWEDNKPTEAYITLVEPQEQPKQEIDWEQRQYELTKDILIKTYFDKKNTLLYDSDIHSAISYANRIIEKLKKQNK